MNDPEEILNVLVIEDNPDDAELLLREFKRAKLAVEAQVVSNAGAIVAAFAEGDWDVVLSDYNIPGTSFSHTLSLAKEADSHMPVIVVSGAVGEEVAVQLMREGASDLILKHNMSKLVPIVERELNVAEQNRARRESERRFMDIVMASADWVWETDSGHRLSFDMGGREQAEWSDPLRALGRTHWEAVGADPEVDTNWREHLQQLDALRSVIGLRGYAQRDPLNEYKTEAFNLFEHLLESLREEFTRRIMGIRIQMQQRPQAPQPPRQMQAIHTDPKTGQNEMASAGDALGDHSEIDPNNPATWGKVPRNSPCPCGSGKKYKHCHGALVA